jgi:hypothetical protein
MGRYLTNARYHLERIQYYHRVAGSNGHKQAANHYHELCTLIERAMHSKNDKNDAVVIAVLKQSAHELMDEMRGWLKDDND